MTSRFWSATVRGLQPYTPGEQPQGQGLLKLNTNESPYPPSPRVLEALAAVRGEDLLRYPDPNSTELCAAIAGAHGVAPGQVFVGNGSDEVLSHVFLALLKRPGDVLFPDITYSFYPVWCRLHGIAYREVPLDEAFGLDPAAYAPSAPAVILPNPNAPTGRLLPLAQIRRFLEEAPDRLLVVDEAYVDYGGESAIPLIESFDNLLVVQTLSKSRALAGLRVGFAIGSEVLVEGLNRVKNSFNSYPLDVVAQRGAVAALGDQAWYADCCARVACSRETLRAGLEALGFEVLPSVANFLFVRHGSRRGEELFQALRAAGIIVRRWDKPRIHDFLRITVGTDDDVARVLRTLEEILAGPAA